MKLLIIILLSFITFYSYSNPVTWYNSSWKNLNGESWNLSIQEEDLPDNSLCSFGERIFNPVDAIKGSICWLNKSGYEGNNFRVQDIKIYTMGKEWKQCVYILNLRNDENNSTMYLGVDLKGNVHEPLKMPLTIEKVQNKKIEKCIK